MPFAQSRDRACTTFEKVWGKESICSKRSLQIHPEDKTSTILESNHVDDRTSQAKGVGAGFVSWWQRRQQTSQWDMRSVMMVATGQIGWAPHLFRTDHFDLKHQRGVWRDPERDREYQKERTRFYGRAETWNMTPEDLAASFSRMLPTTKESRR